MGKKETNKSLRSVEVETKGKLLQKDSLLPTSENNAFRSQCLKFYVCCNILERQSII